MKRTYDKISQDIVKTRDDAKMQLCKINKQMDELRRTIDNLDNIIRDICDHKWEVDRTEVSPCHTWMICNKCGLSKW